mmetsp:Transcript_19321/g.53096  ORF Transcript_19321/g.53096 Transcript_19321/m.53096 type:complete len:216 (-) Transcript_19321:738-1385(-)
MPAPFASSTVQEVFASAKLGMSSSGPALLLLQPEFCDASAAAAAGAPLWTSRTLEAPAPMAWGAAERALWTMPAMVAAPTSPAVPMLLPQPPPSSNRASSCKTRPSSWHTRLTVSSSASSWSATAPSCSLMMGSARGPAAKTRLVGGDMLVPLLPALEPWPRRFRISVRRLERNSCTSRRSVPVNASTDEVRWLSESVCSAKLLASVACKERSTR